jgi:hypothetical protein
VVPAGEVGGEFGAGADGDHLAGFFHRAIPGELGLGHGPGLGGGAPAEDGAVGVVFEAGELGGDADGDVAAAEFREGNGAAAAVGFVAEVSFALTNLGEGAREVAVPLEGVHREVEVGVEDQAHEHRMQRP